MEEVRQQLVHYKLPGDTTSEVARTRRRSNPIDRRGLSGLSR